MDKETNNKTSSISLVVSLVFKNPKRVFIISIIWTFVILLLTGIPGNSFPKNSEWLDIFQVDKLIHLGMFIPFSLLWLLFLELKNISINIAITTVSFFGIIYGILTEVLQHYVFIGRSANVPDAIADTIGVVVGVLIFKITLSRSVKNKN